jgi:hypothetical protein
MSTDDRTSAVPCLHGVAEREFCVVCETSTPGARVHAPITVGMVVADKSLVKAMVRVL